MNLDSLKGWLCIAGLGPGDLQLVTPEVTAALDAATDIVGYIPYVARIPPRPGLHLHASDNRVEMDRARAALQMASEGKQVVIVSSGDPGVFAMAAAVFEALEDRPDWQALDIHVLPGITAMLAAAARTGAPLGHDFCAINLSDNLKPRQPQTRRTDRSPRARRRRGRLCHGVLQPSLGQSPAHLWPRAGDIARDLRTGPAHHLCPCCQHGG